MSSRLLCLLALGLGPGFLGLPARQGVQRRATLAELAGTESLPARPRQATEGPLPWPAETVEAP